MQVQNKWCSEWNTHKLLTLYLHRASCRATSSHTAAPRTTTRLILQRNAGKSLLREPSTSPGSLCFDWLCTHCPEERERERERRWSVNRKYSALNNSFKVIVMLRCLVTGRMVSLHSVTSVGGEDHNDNFEHVLAKTVPAFYDVSLQGKMQQRAQQSPSSWRIWFIDSKYCCLLSNVV